MTQKELVTAPLKVKPFLKWAGGKTQLLEQMTAYFPPELKSGDITRYVEPFVGSGAVFFHLIQTYQINKAYLFDVNDELILAYNTIKSDVSALVCKLENIQEEYLKLSATDQEEYFYDVRHKFNHQRRDVDFNQYQPEWVNRTAQIIFLNRTCFNGLFRVNGQGEFNVPFGRYKNPQICNAENLLGVSRILQKAIIKRGDFTRCERVVNSNTFVYFDPPYRPISTTASFTSYSKFEFGDKEQRRLAQFYRQLDKRGAKLMLSNSDPKNNNAEDRFFESLYDGFKIKRVQASRMINSDAKKRGKIGELLIINYRVAAG